MDLKQRLSVHLEKFGQEHLLAYWDDIEDHNKELLRGEIEEIDFEQLRKYYEQIRNSKENQEVLEFIEPVPKEVYGSVNDTNDKDLYEYRREGLKQIADGKVGVILLAGGQGTRLGVPYPKGMYSVNLPSGKSLFQIQVERIRKLQQLASQEFKKEGSITLYIMTSDATMSSTESYFKKHNYFGLDKNNIVMFEQGTLPCIDNNGKVLLDSKFRIAKAPNGNGGIYKALKDKKILNDMENRNIKYLHAYSVDNILVRVADPVFIGYCVKKGADCAAKVVEKVAPEEAVGVVCRVNDKYQVVEYSEIPKELSEERNLDGKLKFNAGSICNHFFTTDFLKDVSNIYESKLKVHEARKKIPCLDETGVRRIPEKVNGIKIEKFIFDIFPFAKNFVVWEVPREEEFSALKNGPDAAKDTPKTSRQDLCNLHRSYIIKAGGKIIGEGHIEISPLLSYAGEGLEEVCKSPIMATEEWNELTEKHSKQNGYH